MENLNKIVRYAIPKDALMVFSNSNAKNATETTVFTENKKQDATKDVEANTYVSMGITSLLAKRMIAWAKVFVNTTGQNRTVLIVRVPLYVAIDVSDISALIAWGKEFASTNK
jgi:phosphoserine aminotransferase